MKKSVSIIAAATIPLLMKLNIQYFAGSKFDSKSFNPQAFGRYVQRIPNLKRNELIKSGALTGNAEIRQMFSSQTGTAYGVIPFKGLIGGTPLNYDGQTDITAQTTTTYEQGVVVVGRAQAWTERDFSYDITGKVDFMDNVAQQVASYWDAVDQDTLLAILKGIFSMTGTGNVDFVNNHTFDITNETENVVGATTLNNAIQQAAGDNKSTFKIALVHSAIATNLENLQLLKYMTYTDAQGIQRQLEIGTWNGRVVLVDDSMPTETTELGDTVYTSYVLGQGAFSFEDIGAKVPYEMDRDPKINGGQDTLYSRQRKVFAPYGISYTKTSQATLSPTDAELQNGANWTLVNDGNGQFINHRAIPIAQIKSLG